MLSCSQFSNAPIGNAQNFAVASLSSMRHTMSLSIFDRVSVDISKGCWNGSVKGVDRCVFNDTENEYFWKRVSVEGAWVLKATWSTIESAIFVQWFNLFCQSPRASIVVIGSWIQFATRTIDSTQTSAHYSSPARAWRTEASARLVISKSFFSMNSSIEFWMEISSAWIAFWHYLAKADRDNASDHLVVWALLINN